MEYDLVSDYERGRWDMFVLISSIEYGKQCYFLQDDGLVYSRRSCKYMSIEDAVNEFLDVIENDY